MRSFRELDVWSKAHALVQAVYRATKRLPKVGYFPGEEFVRLTEDVVVVKKMLSGFVRRI